MNHNISTVFLVDTIICTTMLIFFVMIFSAVYFSAVTPAGHRSTAWHHPSAPSLPLSAKSRHEWIDILKCSVVGHSGVMSSHWRRCRFKASVAVSVLHVWLLLSHEWSNFTGSCKYCGKLLWWGFDAHLSMMCWGANQLCIVIVCERRLYHTKITRRRMYLLELRFVLWWHFACVIYDSK